jgi:ABC-type dipeptide/oligopeptide/nickel transport system ATPase component
MKSRLHRIEIRNFKAFREFALDLFGRHLLVYGPNGSGKSSLYWALYTFLQSARKQASGVAKYFDPGDGQNLLNIYEQREATPKAGEIAATLRDAATQIDTPYRISQTAHDTHNQPAILKGDRASDFITYRFFFGFSDFRNSQSFNVWPLFEKEILPFCVSTATASPSPIEMWNDIKAATPNPSDSTGRAGARAYATFHEKTKRFASILAGIVDPISAEAQAFYDKHFSSDDAVKLTLRLALKAPPSSSGNSREKFRFNEPDLEFGIQVDGDTIARPQSFLNEAKLTQLALSVRFAASLVNLHESDLKLLVLDDLLVSLDMSNRMKVVDILLSDTFANYQKFILTHDLGLFQEIRRHIGINHDQWHFCKLTGNAKDGPQLASSKSDLEMAQDYLANDQLAECGNRLRKCAEANLENFLRAAKDSRGLATLYDNAEFSSLGLKIGEAKNLLALEAHHAFAKLLENQFSVTDLATLLSRDEIDPTKFAKLPRDERGKVIAKLMAARSDLHQIIIALISDASRIRLNAIKILEDVERIKDRILNPASHAGVTPIYTKEAEDAVKVIQSLDAALTSALATL